MDEISIEKDNETYVVRMSPAAFAAFAFYLLNQPKPSEAPEKRRKLGRPTKEPEGSGE
jgi:hypothetical protein